MNNNYLIYSAGILPYSVKYDGTIFFLLGKDYENKWSDFGGRCEAVDKSDPSSTASREFWEETLGSIYDINYIRKIIKKCKYIESKTYLGYPYYMYLLKIPYKEDYKNNFRNTRSFINNITIDRKYREKIDIRWFSLDAINNHKGFFTMKNVFLTTIEANKKKIEEIVSNLP